MTTASKNAFITGLCVVVAPVLSFLFLRENRSWKVVLALVLAVIGLWIISFGFTLRVGGMGMGDFLTLLSALAFGVQVFMIHLFSRQGLLLRHDVLPAAGRRRSARSPTR